MNKRSFIPQAVEPQPEVGRCIDCGEETDLKYGRDFCCMRCAGFKAEDKQ